MPEERLGKQLAHAAKAVQARFSQALGDAGTSLHTYLVLRHIESYPEISQAALAERLGIEAPTLSHHLDRLEARGLIVRQRRHNDRRTSHSELTDAGRAELAAGSAVAGRLDEEFRALFTSGELAAFERLLARISAHYAREPEVGRDELAG